MDYFRIPYNLGLTFNLKSAEGKKKSLRDK